MKESKRKLVKTFPGLPEGAGIYDDGVFYNCAAGKPSQIIHHDEDRFYSVVDNELVFDFSHPHFNNVKNGLNLAGIDIYNIESADELEKLMSFDIYGEHIAKYIQTKRKARRPRTTFQKMLQACDIGDLNETDRLSELLKKRSVLGLYLIAKD